MSDQKIAESIGLRDTEQMEALSKMLSKTVHDMNNPLAVFIGQISIMELLLKKDPVDMEKLQKVITKFRSASEGLKEHIAQLRTYYKIPINDPQFDRCYDLIDAVFYFFAGDITKREITVDKDLKEDTSLEVKPAPLFIALRNVMQLVINVTPDEGKLSFKFDHEGGKLSFEITSDVITPRLVEEWEVDLLACELLLGPEGLKLERPQGDSQKFIIKTA